MTSVIRIGRRLPRKLAVTATVLLAASSWAGSVAAAQDGTIFDDRVFEWRYYLDPNVNPDLQSAGLITEAQARSHWQTNGINEGRRGGPGFMASQYLGLYVDLRNAYGATNYSGAISHYLVHGYNERRYGQSSCPTNYDLSGFNVNVPAYCFARSLNATITSTEQYFAKYLYCFPLPAGGRNVSGLSGSVSINTATAQDNPSEALVVVGHTPNACPANGTRYGADWNIPPLVGSRTLASFITKRQGAGSVTASTNVDFPAVGTSGGSLFVLLDGGPSLGSGKPIASITMKSNMVLKTAASAHPSKYFINGSDEYCYMMTGGCQAASTSNNVTFVTAQRASGGGASLMLFGNTSAGSITRPIGWWTSRHDWYVTPCANVPGMPSTAGRHVYTVAGRAAIPAGTPSYGYEQGTSGDSLHWTVNNVLPLPSTGVRAGTDCIVHLAYANVNSQIDIESQVNYMLYY